MVTVDDAGSELDERICQVQVAFFLDDLGFVLGRVSPDFFFWVAVPPS